MGAPVVERTYSAASDDDELVRQFQLARDPSAFSELFSRHSPRVYRYCCRLLRDPATAEEMTQDVFIRAFRCIDQYQAGSFFGWLRTIALNLCRNEIERSLRQKKREEKATPDAADLMIPGWQMHSVDGLLRDIGVCLELLKPEHAQALKLFYFDGYSYREVAALLGMEVNEVRSKLQHARSNFRKVWEARTGSGPRRSQ